MFQQVNCDPTTSIRTKIKLIANNYVYKSERIYQNVTTLMQPKVSFFD